MEETGILKAGTPAVSRALSPRHQPERHARLQRAPDAVACAPARQPLQDRDRTAHQAVGADRLGHHARAGGGRPAAAQRAGARQDRPAVDPDVAQSGRRVLPRPEDRPAQRRAGADRFPRQRSRHAAAFLPLPCPARDGRVRQPGHQADPRRADARRRTGASPASASPCRSSCGTGPTPPARRAR